RVGDTLGTVLVQVQDHLGNPETAYGGQVLLTLSSDPSALAGTNPRSAGGGTASFADLSVSRAGTYQLIATSGGLPPQSSTSLTLTPLDPSVAAPPVSPGTLLLSANPQTVNLTARVSNADNAFPVNEGTVSFTVYDPSNNPVGQAVSGTVSGGTAGAGFTLPG